jgi:pimeloyl-ACP methyl ester carboxylesterase
VILDPELVMKGPLAFALLLSIASCRSASPGVTGDWVGDLSIGTATMPLRVTIDSTAKAATVTFRPWQLRDAPGAIEQSSGRLSVALDSVRLEGSVREGAWSGSGARGSDSGRFELRRVMTMADADWAPIMGTYRTDDGKLLGVARFDEFGPRPLLVDYTTGRIGPLLPLDSSRFLLGHAITAPVFPADTVRLTRGAGGSVERLTEQVGGQPAVTGARLPTRDEEFHFNNGDVELAGTLTLPPGPGPFPAIVLVHGSNALTRHFLGPWARYFPALGFAVLAYDKRGTGTSKGDWREADFKVLADDVLAGVRALAARKDIEADRIGLWGISQAGWIMPLAVANAKPKEIAFMIVHSGSGTTPREQGILNYEYNLRYEGVPDSLIPIARQYQTLNDSVTKLGKDLELAQSFYQSHRARAPFLYEPQPLDAWFRGYYRMIMDFDPVPFWQRVKIPVLLFFGGLDAIVPPVESWPPIERGLAAAHNGQVTHYVLPLGNHVLLEAKTGTGEEYASRTRFVAGYFDRMAEWLRPFTQ